MRTFTKVLGVTAVAALVLTGCGRNSDTGTTPGASNGGAAAAGFPANAVIGVALGTGVALPLTRLLSDLLYEISPTDPVTFVGVGALVAVVAAVAAWFPARRAMRIDPATTIRDA